MNSLLERCGRGMARPFVTTSTISLALSIGALPLSAPASADNRRLNESVFVNIYTAQQRNGCTTDPKIDPRLVDAARRHAFDVRDHRDINGDIGSDGSSTRDRAVAAGFTGPVDETVAINPALAISGIEILNQWWYEPEYRAIMQDCSHNAIGVWSENSLDRTVVVAVYGERG